MIYDDIAMNNGVIFQHAYDILSQRMEDGVRSIESRQGGISNSAILDTSLAVPVIVNGSFACELYLKALLPKGTRGHELNDLFNKLDARVQENIRCKTIEKMKDTISDYNDTTFQSDINNNCNHFAKWRYFHEGISSPANLKFIKYFMASILDVIQEERQH